MKLIEFAYKNIHRFGGDKNILHICHEDVLNQIQDNKFNIITKSRRVGLTSLFALYLTWELLYGNKKNFILLEDRNHMIYFLIREYLYRDFPYYAYSIGSKGFDNNNVILFNGVKINFISDFHDIRNLILKGTRYSLILDDVIFNNNGNQFHFSEFIVKEIMVYGTILELTVATTMSEDNIIFMDGIRLPMSGVIVPYKLHYSKVPFWTIYDLEQLSKTLQPHIWAMTMDCEIDAISPWYNKTIELKPFKTQKMLEIENFMLNEINNYD